MNLDISFTRKNEATFVCREDSYEEFREFLKKEGIHILGQESHGNIASIYVENVDNGEATQLISKYNTLLRG